MNVSEKTIKITNKDFSDMIRRYNKFVEMKKREPQIIYLKDIGSGDYVSLERFKDMLKRWNRFKATEGREPIFVWIKYPKPANTDSECVNTGYFEKDIQDTGYSCGASSLKMALSSLGVTTTEQEIMRRAWTNINGTTHDGMINATRSYGFKGVFKSFISLGWARIAEHIQNGGEVILHIMTQYLAKDCNGESVWRGSYGHYIYLYAVCLNKGICYVADPSKGVRCHTFKQLEGAMAAVTWTESVYLISK